MQAIHIFFNRLQLTLVFIQRFIAIYIQIVIVSCSYNVLWIRIFCWVTVEAFGPISDSFTDLLLRKSEIIVVGIAGLLGIFNKFIFLLICVAISRPMKILDAFIVYHNSWFMHSFNINFSWELIPSRQSWRFCRFIYLWIHHCLFFSKLL